MKRKDGLVYKDSETRQIGRPNALFAGLRDFIIMGFVAIFIGAIVFSKFIVNCFSGNNVNTY